MAGGVVVDGVFTPSPNIYVTPKFGGVGGRPPGQGVVAAVGSFPFLAKGVTYISTSPTTMELLSPNDAAVKRIADLAWDPSDDPDMQGTPSAVVLCSIDETTRASAYLQTAADANGVLIQSKVYGPRGNMVLASFTDNTALGGVDVVASINGEVLDQFFVGDDDAVIKLLYTNPTTLDASGHVTAKGFAGSQLGAGGSGAVNVAVASGDVTVSFAVALGADRVDDTGAEYTWVPSGPVNGPVTVVTGTGASLTTATHLMLEFVGVAAGAPVTERVRLTDIQVSGNTPIETTTSWASLSYVKAYPTSTGTGGLPGTAGTPTGSYGGGTLNFSGRCFPVMNAANGQLYAADVIRAVNTQVAGGFAASTGSSFAASTLLTQLDTLTTTAFSVSTVSVAANAYRLVEAINTKSQLLVATLLLNVPIDVSAPVYAGLSGGSVSAGSNSDYPEILAALEWEDINTVVAFSTSDTVHGYVRAHCDRMSAVGANERNMFAAHAADATLSTVLAAAKAHNTRHTTLVIEEADIVAYTGALERYTTYEYAFSLACMENGQRQAPLTRKLTRAKAVHRHSSTMSREAINVLTAGGVLTTVARPGEGLRIERWVTTYTATTDPSQTDGSAVDSTYDCCRAVRTDLKRLIGTAGTSLLKGVIYSTVAGTLDRLVRQGVIRDWDKATLYVYEYADRYDVVFDYTPTYPFNFGKITPRVKVPLALAA